MGGTTESSELALRHPGRDQRDDKIDRLERENQSLHADYNRIRQELQDTKGELRVVLEGVQGTRDILAPLYRSLRMLWGELDTISPNDPPAGRAPAKHAELWKDWQRKLGEGTAASRAIEVLLMHGKMKREALKVHLKCGNSTLTDAIFKLNRADLVVKDGSYISLKEL